MSEKQVGQHESNVVPKKRRSPMKNVSKWERDFCDVVNVGYVIVREQNRRRVEVAKKGSAKMKAMKKVVRTKKKTGTKGPKKNRR